MDISLIDYINRECVCVYLCILLFSVCPQTLSEEGSSGRINLVSERGDTLTQVVPLGIGSSRLLMKKLRNNKRHQSPLVK